MAAHGTAATADLYFELKPTSVNLGAVDYTELLAGRPQTLATNPDGAFQLFRIGTLSPAATSTQRLRRAAISQRSLKRPRKGNIRAAAESEPLVRLRRKVRDSTGHEPRGWKGRRR